MLKYCIVCKTYQHKHCFYKNKRYKDGLNSICKECKKDIDARDYKKHKYKRSLKSKEYYQQHKEKIIQDSVNYQKHHKDERSNYMKDYKNKNDEKLKEYRRSYDKKRKKNDLNFKLACSLRRRQNDSIKKGFRNGSFVRDLGCSIQDLKLHLEKKFYSNPRTNEQMSWNNWTTRGWHIDHIIPLADFDLTDRKQFLGACHYTNLQPLWWFENLKKR